VLDYGVSFFYEALAAHAVINREKVKSMAVAMRASKLDERHFKEFLKNG